jgi:eukaryotic-like serine/threonine-protein kinase
MTGGDGWDPFEENERFSIIREIGKGAFGSVFLVQDHQENREVAAKVLHNRSPTALALFKQEFRSLSDVIARNLIQFYELFSDGNAWFFTMEYIEGQEFLSYVIHGPQKDSKASAEIPFAVDSPTIVMIPGKAAELDGPAVRMSDSQSSGLVDPAKQVVEPEQLERLRSTLEQLIDGVAFLHKAGMLHRDLKPSNVMVCPDGRVVLLDFGLAADLKGQAQPQSDEPMSGSGTPVYMSPEQAGGDELNEASDWYSVGVMLYQALAARPPFSGRIFQLIYAKQYKDPKQLTDFAPDAPVDLVEFCHSLLLRDPQARPSGPMICEQFGANRPESFTAGERLTRQDLLIGRDPYLHQMTVLYELVKAGEGQLLFVHGPSGIGKSHLIDHFLQKIQVDDAPLILRGRCFQQESMPFKAWDQPTDFLCRYLLDLPKDERERLLPKDLLVLVRLFAVFDQLPEMEVLRGTSIGIVDPKEIRRRAFKAMRELLLLLSRKKTMVIYLEDIHWSDLDSQLLIEEIQRAPGSPAILLICSYRTEDALDSSVLKRALESPQFEQLEIQGLSSNAIAELAKAILGDNGLSNEEISNLARETGGSPYFITELLEHTLRKLDFSEDDQSLNIDDMIRSRARKLGGSTRDLLEILAVAGTPIPKLVVQKALELGAIDPKDLGILRAGSFIRFLERDAGVDLASYHDRIRESILAGLENGKRCQWHNRLAQTFDSLSPVDYGLVAHHLKEAGEIRKAGEYALQAAEEANESLAFDRAAKLYRFALESGLLSKHAVTPVRIKLANTLTNAGRGSESGDEYLKAAKESTVDKSLALRQKAAHQFFTSGHVDRGLTTVRGVLADVGMKLPNYNPLDFAAMLTRDLKFRARGVEFVRREGSEVNPELLLKIDTCWSVFMALSTVDIIAGADFCMRMLLFALEAGEPNRIARALASQAYMDVNLGRMGRGIQVRRSRRLIAQAEQLAQVLGDPYVSGFVSTLKGICEYVEGNFVKSLESCEKGVSLLRDQCFGVPWELDTAHCWQLWNLRALGRIKRYNEILPDLLDDAKNRGDLYAVLVLGSINWNWYLLFAGRWADAADQVQENIVKASKMVSRSAAMHIWADVLTRVDQLIYQGRSWDAWEKARTHWDELVSLQVLDIQFCRTTCWSLRGRAALAAAQGNKDERPRLLKVAKKAAIKLESEIVKVAPLLGRLINAGVLNLQGHQTKALEELESLEKEFMVLGMELYHFVCKRQRGRLLGASGEFLIDQANQFMTQEQIQNPARIAVLLAPGFGP